MIPEYPPFDVLTKEEMESGNFDKDAIKALRDLKESQYTHTKDGEGEEKKMATIADSARGYESKATKNISELDSVSVELNLVEDEFTFTDNKTGDEKTVKQSIIVVKDEKYRVPVSVIQQLQVIIEDRPQLKTFKVKKSGEGKDNTRYTVIGLE